MNEKTNHGSRANISKSVEALANALRSGSMATADALELLTSVSEKLVAQVQLHDPKHKIDSQGLISDLLQAARAAHRLRELDRSINLLEMVFKCAPLQTDALMSLGGIRIEQGDLKTGAMWFRRLLVSCPSHPATLTNFAGLALRNDDVARAATLYRRTLSAAPKSSAAWADYGLALYRIGAYPSAIRALEGALALRPDDGDIIRRLIISLAANDQLDDAISLQRRLLDSAKPNPRDHLKLVAMLRQAGNLDEAITQCHTPTAQTPGLKGRFLIHVARSLITLGRDQEALREIERANEHPESRAEAQKMLLDSRSRNGNFDTFAAAQRDLARMWGYAVVEQSSPFRVLETHDREDGFNISFDLMVNGYLSELQDINSESFECRVHPRASKLFSRSFPRLRFVESEATADTSPKQEAVLHARELPWWFGRPPNFINISRLRADPDATATFRARYRRRAGDAIMVGLCWRSSRKVAYSFQLNPDNLKGAGIPVDRYPYHQSKFWRKSIDLNYFVELINDNRICVFSVQYGLANWEREAISAKAPFDRMIFDEVDHSGDLDAIAAQIAALDCVVSIPCGHGHLSAALGVPTFIAVHEVTPSHWAINDKYRLYGDVTLEAKRLVRGDNGEFCSDYSGDWRPAIDRIKTKILSRFGHPTVNHQ
jgi:tetratricopeptide (TPR) repeat protein